MPRIDERELASCTPCSSHSVIAYHSNSSDSADNRPEAVEQYMVMIGVNERRKNEHHAMAKQCIALQESKDHIEIQS